MYAHIHNIHIVAYCGFYFVPMYKFTCSRLVGLLYLSRSFRGPDPFHLVTLHPLGHCPSSPWLKLGFWCILLPGWWQRIRVSVEQGLSNYAHDTQVACSPSIHILFMRVWPRGSVCLCVRSGNAVSSWTTRGSATTKVQKELNCYQKARLHPGES